MEKMHRRAGKIVGMVLVLAAFLLIGYAVHAVFGRGAERIPIPGAGIQAENTEIVLEDDDARDVPEKGSPVSFDNIDSVLSYDIPEGITKKLNAAAFDAALVAYLEQENLISVSSGEEPGTSLYRVTCDGLLTEDVKHNVFYFDLVVDDGHRTMITAAAGEDHEYTFSRE